MKEINYNDFLKKAKKFGKYMDADSALIDRVLNFTAEWVLGIAQKHAPVDQGTLQSSANSERVKNGVKFGFNTEYAAAQDLGFKGETIKPRRKQALYVPISDKGKRYHTLGANPSTEGLKWGVDYVLKQQVHVPNKSYGSAKGPNKYFSETLERNKEEALGVFRDQLRKELDKHE